MSYDIQKKGKTKWKGKGKGNEERKNEMEREREKTKMGRYKRGREHREEKKREKFNCQMRRQTQGELIDRLRNRTEIHLNISQNRLKVLRSSHKKSSHLITTINFGRVLLLHK